MNVSDIGWAAEPALWVGLVQAVLILLVAFGVPLTVDQKAAVIGLTSAVLAVIGAVVTRSQVTPVAKTPPPHG